MPVTRALRFPWSIFLLLAAAACSPPQKAEFGPEGPPAAPDRKVVWGADIFERYGQERMGAPTGQPAPGNVSYEAPAGWQELPPRQFRDVNLLVRGNPDAECYLTLGVSGSVADNLNRWRQQMGQSSLSVEELRALPIRPFLGTDAALLEVEGSFTPRGGESKDGYLLIGLLAVLEGRVATLKMTGPADLLREERSAFLALADSIYLGGGQPKPSGGTTGPVVSKWRAPEEWQKAADRPMREVTYRIGQQTECYVSVLGGDGGGLRPNFDRWCSQMGRQPLTDEEIASLPTVSMLGTSGLMARLGGSYTGMGGEKIEDAAMLVVACFLADRAVFVKMIGPADEVDANRAEFEQFCSSMEG